MARQCNAQVFLAVLDDAQLVALKVLRGQAGAPVSPLELKQFEAEMALLRSSRHTNVVTLYGGMVDGLGDSYMVTEYLAGGDRQPTSPCPVQHGMPGGQRLHDASIPFPCQCSDIPLQSRCAL